MKSTLSVACLLVAGIASSTVYAQTAASSSAPAAAAGPAKIAVIAFQDAVTQTNEGKRNFEELEKKYQPKQALLKQESDEVDNLKKQLQSQSSTLSDTDRAARLRTIDDKEKSLQRDGQDAQQDFQQDMQQTFSTVAQKVGAIVQTYAQQNGYTVVLDAQQQGSPILWANPATNITEAIIAEYNQKSGVPAPPPSAPAPSTSAPAHRTTTGR